MTDLNYLKILDPKRFEIASQKPSMKAVLTTGNGGYEKLQYCDVAIPIPRAGEVLIKVLAAGMNNTEINTRIGWYSSSIKGATQESSQKSDAEQIKDGGWNGATPFPFIQGTDCCGEVIAKGENAQGPDIGKRVLIRPCMRTHGFDSRDHIWMASDFDGAFAQYVRVPASEVFEVDCDWSDAQLATLPCSYATAENMLHRA